MQWQLKMSEMNSRVNISARYDGEKETRDTEAALKASSYMEPHDHSAVSTRCFNKISLLNTRSSDQSPGPRSLHQAIAMPIRRAVLPH